jgi:hypothetical protein
MTDINTIDITPSWTRALVRIAIEGSTPESRNAAAEILDDAFRKLEMLQRFVDSDDRVLRMLQEFQQQEAAQ